MCRMHVDNNQPFFILRENVNAMELGNGKPQRRHLFVAIDVVEVGIVRKLISNSVRIDITTARAKISGIARLACRFRTLSS